MLIKTVFKSSTPGCTWPCGLRLDCQRCVQCTAHPRVRLLQSRLHPKWRLYALQYHSKQNGWLGIFHGDFPLFQFLRVTSHGLGLLVCHAELSQRSVKCCAQCVSISVDFVVCSLIQGKYRRKHQTISVGRFQQK